MKKYDEYKDSGFDWVGKIPTLWNNLRLRFVCEFRNGFTPSKANPEFWEDGSIPWYRMEDIRDSGRKLSEAKQYITEEAIKGGGLFEAGSFIIATTATIGEHAMLIVDSLANQQFTNLKIRELLSFNILSEFFFYYLFIIDDYCKATTKTSTFPAVSMELLKNCHVVFPSIEDQRSIVDYLNQKCSEIDNIISAQQKRITLLQELKQSVITHAVTKGLNPNVKMKPSGVEWIGDVPKHWEVMPLKYLAVLYPKSDCSNNKANIVSYAPMENVRNDKLTEDEKKITELTSGLNTFYEGDILMAKVTPCFENGNIAIAHSLKHSLGYCSSELFVIRVKRINVRYLFFLLQNQDYKQVCLSTLTGTGGLKRVSADFVRNGKMPVPSQEEQTAITSYLDQKCATIDTSISNAQHQIELLQEYKQSLITEVVTGKRKIC